MRVRHALSALPVLALLLTGCGGRMAAPEGWLPEPGEVPSDEFGAWVEVEYDYYGELVATASGELIAVEADSLYLISSRRILAVGRDKIRHARAELYDPSVGAVKAVALLGGASALSHGFFFPLSLLGWTLAGSAAASVRSQEPTLEYPRDPFDDLARFARFPQGLPRDIGRDSLTPRYHRHR